MIEERKSRYELFLEDEACRAQSTKRCTKCGREKSLGDFYKNTQRNGAPRPACKECMKDDKRRKQKKYRDRVDRFWKHYRAHTQGNGGCLEWITSSKKIPTLLWSGRQTTIRRVVFKLSIGEIPDDMIVITTCRNRKCVRHSHLKLVTRDELRMIMDNSHPAGDLSWASTHSERMPRGEKNGNAKRSENDIRSIRKMYADGMSICAIARSLSTDKMNISRIVNRKTWKHVE